MKGERLVAGLRCSEVLARLSDYVDGALEAPARAAIEAHVRDCDGCTRFGGAFSSVLGALRTRLRSAEPPSDATRRRLAERLAKE